MAHSRDLGVGNIPKALCIPYRSGGLTLGSWSRSAPRKGLDFSGCNSRPRTGSLYPVAPATSSFDLLERTIFHNALTRSTRFSECNRLVSTVTGVFYFESGTIVRLFTRDGQMKNFSIAVFVICAILGIAYGQQGQKKSAHDSAEWKTVADQFMSELVGNRIDKALDLMEPEFNDAAGGK